MSFKQDVLLGDPAVRESEHDILLLSIKNDPFFLKSILCEATKHLGVYSFGLRRSKSLRWQQSFAPDQLEVLGLEAEYPLQSYGGLAGFVDLVGKYALPSDYSWFFGRRKHTRNFFIEVKPEIRSFGETLRQVKAYGHFLNGELKREWAGARKDEFEYEAVIVSYSDRFRQDFLQEDVLLFTAPKNKPERSITELLQASS